MIQEKLMNRKRLLMSSSAAAAAVVVGAGALGLAGGTSLVSNTVPTSHVVSSATTSSSSKPKPPHGPRGFMFRPMGRSVYTDSVVKTKSGSYKTIISVHGQLTAISSTSISVKRPDTGAIVTATIDSSTKYRNTSESKLASDLSSNTAVNVVLVETGGVAKVIAVPPAPGLRPPLGRGPLVKGNTQASNSTSSSGAIA